MVVCTELHQFDDAHGSAGLIQPLPNCCDGNGGGIPDRVTVNSRADGREADTRKITLRREIQAGDVARSQQFRLAVRAIAVHRPDGMKHVLRWQTTRPRHDSASRGASSFDFADSVQLLHQARAAGPVDSTVYAPAAGQSRIRSVDDGIDGYFCNIANQQFNPSGRERDHVRRCVHTFIKNPAGPGNNPAFCDVISFKVPDIKRQSIRAVAYNRENRLGV